MRFPYEPKTTSFIDTAPVSFRDFAVLNAPVDRVFAAFADAESWTRWFPMMRRARWLSDSHEGIGAEREVSLVGLGTFGERFLVWEPNKRFCFTIFESSSPLARAVVEDFRFSEPGLGKTRIDWIFSIEPAPAARLITPLFEKLMRSAFKKSGRNLERYLEGGR
ncbi:MAG: SRPBCC family protein [Polyangiaceae bacterium]